MSATKREIFDEIKRRRDERRDSIARLSAFIRYSWPITNPGSVYEHNWHVEAVADHVQAQLEEWAEDVPTPALQDLLINIPPRCLKSTIVSVCATAWAWLRWPKIRIGCLSVNPRVSFRDALAVRTLIRSVWYQQSFSPEWTIREDQNSIGSFANTAGGSRIARGFESNVVGEGFDWILVDDPHEPRESATAVQKVLDGWDVAVSSRLNDARRSIRTGIMQAVTEGDFSDHVRKQGWRWLCLPMEFEREHQVPWPHGGADPRTADGEILHPRRFPPRVLEQRKLELGPYGYAAQYQQRPAPLEGGMIKRTWFQRFQLSDIGTRGTKLDLDWLTVTVDATFGAKGDHADAVGLLVVGGKGPRRYVFEDASRPMSFIETIAAIKALLGAWPDVRKILIEKSANGPAIAEQLRAGVQAGSLRTIVVEELTSHMLGDKKSRTMAMTPTLAAGLVFLLDGAAWISAFIGEFGLWPNGRHDDRIDALSQCLAYYDEESGAAQARKMLGLGSMLRGMRR